MARFGLVGAVVLTLLAFAIQQTIVWTSAFAPAGVDPDAPVTAPGFDQLTLMSKVMVKLHAFTNGADDGSVMAEIDPLAISTQEQVRVAIVAGEVEGPDEAIQRLEALRFASDGVLRDDIDLFRGVYRSGPEILDEIDRAGLIERHGWFARLAFAYDQPASNADRKHVTRFGGLMVFMLICFVLGALALLAGSLTCFILMLVKLTSGKVRSASRSPAPGGSVYIEMFCLFLVAFLGVLILSAIIGAMSPAGSHLPMYATLLLIWLVVPVLGWPLLRGVSWERYCGEMGLHRGRGLGREIFAGLCVYLASLPIYFVALIIGVVIELILSQFRPVAVGNEAILDLPSNPAPMAMLLFLAMTVWAPVVEEIAFRGALFRHLSSMMIWPAAAVVSAVAFGIAHPYSLGLLVPVGTLGFMFALMRQWRGSIIACITAHAFHNGMLATILITLILVLQD